MLPPFSRQLSVHIISPTLHCSDILVVCGVQPEELALPAAEELALPPEESAYDREVGTVERLRNDYGPKVNWQLSTENIAFSSMSRFIISEISVLPWRNEWIKMVGLVTTVQPRWRATWRTCTFNQHWVKSKRSVYWMHVDDDTLLIGRNYISKTPASSIFRASFLNKSPKWVDSCLLKTSFSRPEQPLCRPSVHGIRPIN